MKVLAVTAIFLGSALSFCIQPMVGRTLLPHFGGTSAVWLACLGTFQVLLLAGYGYARTVVDRRWQKSHAAFLFAAVGLLALTAGRGMSWTQILALITGMPVFNTILAVLAVAGVPCVLLSANATLVQSRMGGAYHLYSISNLGSFTGLIAYPFLFEPFLELKTQWLVLAVGVLVYALLFAGLALNRTAFAARTEQAEVCEERGRREAPSWLYCAIPLVSTYLLNAVTAHLTVDIAPLPLVWCFLLGIYLLTWVVGFSNRGSRLQPLWWFLTVIALVAVLAVHRPNEMTSLRLAFEFTAATGLLLFGGSALHALLYLSRPTGAKLGQFNFLLALGGAIGGVLSGILSPLLFNSLLEWPIALVTVAAFAAFWMFRVLQTARFADLPIAALQKVVGVGFGLFVFGVWIMVRADRQGDLANGRSFYGPWRVYTRNLPTRDGRSSCAITYFKHGGTAHGFEPANELDRGVATGYYAPENGGLAFTLNPRYAAGHPIRAELVGLGIGTMAWYGRPGDIFQFDEICPQVTDVATKCPWFDYVRNSKATVSVKIGDARQTLEAERAAQAPHSDVLVIDAFSGDSVPIHLLTVEAFQLYSDRLAEDGILALHLSNWHTDLLPLVKRQAKDLGLEIKFVCDGRRKFSMEATWAFLSRYPIVLPENVRIILPEDIQDLPTDALPTDSRGSLLQFIRF